MKDKIQTIDDTINDLVSDFLYYDRKEDNVLPQGCIEAMIEKGEITVDGLINTFSHYLRKGLEVK